MARNAVADKGNKTRSIKQGAVQCVSRSENLCRQGIRLTKSVCGKQNCASKQEAGPCNVYFVRKCLQTSDTFYTKHPCEQIKQQTHTTKINFKLHMQTKQEPTHAMYPALYKRCIPIIFCRQVMGFSKTLVQETNHTLPNKTRIHAVYTSFLNICRRGILFAQNTRINKTDHILKRAIKCVCNLN